MVRIRESGSSLSLELFLFMQPGHFWLNAVARSTRAGSGGHLEFKGTRRPQQSRAGAAPGCTKVTGIHICFRGSVVSWWSFWLRSRRRTTSATFWGGPHPVEFGWGLGSPLSTVYGVSRKGSVEGQEMRAPSSQHSDGQDVALLPAQDADGIPGCSDPRVCLCPFPLLLLLLCLAQTTEIYFPWF